MAKLISYDNTGVETSGGGTGVKAKPGVYIGKIEKCTHRTETKKGAPANDLEVVLNIGDEFDWVYDYVQLDIDWKIAEFTRAVGLPDKGKIDPDKMIGKIVRVKINPGSYNEQYSPDVGRLMKPLAKDKTPGPVSQISGSDTATDEPAGDEPNAATDEPQEKVYDDPEFKPYREGQESPEDGSEVASYDEWADDDLAAECQDRGLTIPGGRGSKKDKMVAALRAEDEEVAGEEAQAVEPEADPDASGDDNYDEWDLDRLKEEWEARNLGDLPAIRGRGAAERLKDAITEELRKDDAENPFDA